MTFSKLKQWVWRIVLALALATPMVTTSSVSASAHGYHHGGHHHGYYKRKRRRNRDVALGVIGGVLALGTIAALADSNRRSRRYYRDDRRYYRGGSCDYWADQCARNWGTRNRNFYGCLRYHRC